MNRILNIALLFNLSEQTFLDPYAGRVCERCLPAGTDSLVFTTKKKTT